MSSQPLRFEEFHTKQKYSELLYRCSLGEVIIIDSEFVRGEKPFSDSMRVLYKIVGKGTKGFPRGKKITSSFSETVTTLRNMTNVTKREIVDICIK